MLRVAAFFDKIFGCRFGGADLNKGVLMLRNALMFAEMGAKAALAVLYHLHVVLLSH